MAKQNTIKQLKRLRSENFENLFNVYQTSDGFYYYSLLQNIVFPNDLPKTLFTKYRIRYGDTWPFISYKTLGSPNLWWLILLANKIRNPINTCIVGTVIDIPIKQVVQEVLNQIK